MGEGKTPQIKIADLKKIRLAFDETQFNSVVMLVDSLLCNQEDKILYEKLCYELFWENFKNSIDK